MKQNWFEFHKYYLLTFINYIITNLLMSVKYAFVNKINANRIFWTSYDYSDTDTQRNFHRGRKRGGRHEGRKSLAKSESLNPWLGQRARYHPPQREFDGKE